jgi:hypothetical protein
MSEQQNRIAALLNSGSSTTAAPTTTPDPGTYDIPAGKDATTRQLGIDSTPDALISVDGHQVAAGDNGLSVDIAPDGSTHVIHGPQDGTQPGGTTGQYGQAPSTVPAQNSTSGTGQTSTVPAQNSALDTGQNAGTATDPSGNGTQPLDTGGSTAPLGNDVGQSGTQQTGLPQTQTPPPDTPIEHLHGTGEHAAQADLAMFGPGTHTPATVTHHNPDGSMDVTIPKGQDNPHAVTVHVKPNDDGSLDITVPKSETNPHEIKIHVQPDKHVDLNITQDKDGHLKIDAHDHPPDQKGDWPGLKKPVGQGGGNAADPNGPNGQALPQTPQMPETPKTPGGGGGAPPGGGGAPSGGGGGPSGGGGGLPNQGDGKTPPPKTQPPPAVPATGYASIRQQSITDLGKDIDSGPVQTMNNAHKAASEVNVGYPGFGVAGAAGGLAGAHTEVRDAGAKQFLDGHTSLSKWVPNLKATAVNWQGAEDDSTTQVNGIPK